MATNLAEVAAWGQRLSPLHAAWVGEGRNEGMAASLETCAWLCAHAGTGAVLELGSGFSSVALRLATEAPVVTVDDDPHWLEETGRFLDRNGIDRGVLTLARPESSFDLVFHDLGNMQTRAATLEYALDRVGRKGYVVLDDVHFEVYGAAARTAVGRRGFRVQDSGGTLDKFGRHALIAWRP